MKERGLTERGWGDALYQLSSESGPELPPPANVEGRQRRAAFYCAAFSLSLSIVPYIYTREREAKGGGRERGLCGWKRADRVIDTVVAAAAGVAPMADTSREETSRWSHPRRGGVRASTNGRQSFAAFRCQRPCEPGHSSSSSSYYGCWPVPIRHCRRASRATGSTVITTRLLRSPLVPNGHLSLLCPAAAVPAASSPSSPLATRSLFLLLLLLLHFYWMNS